MLDPTKLLAGPPAIQGRIACRLQEKRNGDVVPIST